MKILVTGGAGFIGSNVVDRYIDLGHNVIVIDNLYTGKKENINPAAKFYNIDIRSREIENIFHEEKPDVVNHLAAQIDVRVSVTDPSFDNSVNVAGFINILENVRKYRTKRVIFSSSGGVIYGDTDMLPCTEDSPKMPLSPYGISKWASELYLQFYSKIYGLEYVALRYANVYGPRQDGGEAGVISIFIRRMLNNKKCTIFGDGKQLRDYVYVGDVAKANELALTTGENIGINIGTSIPVSVNFLYKQLSEIIGINESPVYAAVRPGELYKNYLDNSLARSILDWSPKTNFHNGLLETINFFREENK